MAMKIVAQPGADIPLDIEGDPDTSYEVVFQDTGLQRITRVTVTTDDSGNAVATPPIGFGIGAWAISAVPADGSSTVSFVGVDEGDGNFTAVDVDTAISGGSPLGSQESDTPSE